MVGVTGSIPVAPTTHSRFLLTCGDAAKMPTNGGLFQCVVRISESLEGQTAEFGPRSPRQKIPFLAPKRCGAEKLRLLSLRAASEACKCEDRNQGWARPSRSNCSDHSAGASRKLATPMPRGSRPSTVAFTRAGAMKAIDIVMLT